MLLRLSHFSLFDFYSESERLLKFKGSPIAQLVGILPFASMDKMLTFDQWYSYISLPSSIWEVNYDVIISNTKARWLPGTCTRSTMGTHPLLSWLREAQFTVSCVGQVICSCMKWAAFWMFPSNNMFQLKNFYDSLCKSIQIFTWISTSL